MEEVQLNGSVNCIISRIITKFDVDVGRSGKVRRRLSRVLDENTAQVGENDKLREHQVSGSKRRQGLKCLMLKVNLEAIYDDGFHICPDFWSTS